MKLKKVYLILCVSFFLIFIKFSSVAAQTETPTPTTSLTPTPTPNNVSSEKLSDLQKQIKELEGKISSVQSQKKTLSSQIAVMDNQIKLTQLRINAVKGEVFELSEDIKKANQKISKLEKALFNLTKVLLNRIVVTYQIGSVEPFHVLLYSNDIADFFTRANYLKIVQAHDKKLIFETEQAKNDYANQKSIYENKKKKVEALKIQLETFTKQLDQEKSGKQQLLEITNNDEKRYQDLLAKARAEYEAIQGIIAGKGQEAEVSDIKEGSTIATVIAGSSYCSTGSHLHFEVVENAYHTDPSKYLSSKDVTWDLCGWFGCDNPFAFSGSWQWPINGKPIVTQGYGLTAYARSGAYGGGPHTGIDMISDDLSVKAVRDGKLYQGSIACGGGRLRYVKVDHNDSNLDTYYLHVNYVF